VAFFDLTQFELKKMNLLNYVWY